eukprot:gene11972-59755_t
MQHRAAPCATPSGSRRSAHPRAGTRAGVPARLRDRPSSRRAAMGEQQGRRSSTRPMPDDGELSLTSGSDLELIAAVAAEAIGTGAGTCMQITPRGFHGAGAWAEEAGAAAARAALCGDEARAGE